MNCKKAELYLVEYLYQELSPKKTVAIEKHLQACDQCKKTLESWRAIHRGYQRSSEELQPSSYLKQRLLVMAKEQLAKPPSLAERLLMGLKIAAVPVLIFGILMILHMQQQKSTEMAQVKQATPSAPAEIQDKNQPLRKMIAGEKRRDVPASSSDLRSNLGKDESAEGGRKQEAVKTLGYVAEEKQKSFADNEYSRRTETKTDSSYGEQEKAGAYAPAAPPPAAEAPAQMELSEPVPQKAAKVAASKEQKETDADQLFIQAVDDINQNRLKDGMENIKRAAETDSSQKYAQQLHQMGIESQNKRDYLHAIGQFNAVLTNYRNYNGNEDVLVRLAESYEAVGQFGDAISVYKQLLKSHTRQRQAQQKIDELGKKQETQQQLKDLGYVKE